MYRVAVVISCALFALDATADSGAADRAVTEAQTRAANNDFVGAAAKYREAFTAEPRPELMCNVGVAYYKAKDLPRAQRYLDQCLSIGTALDRAFIDNVKKVLTAVESALAKGSYTPVDLLVQPATATTTVEGGVPFDEPLVGSRRLWFPLGHYRLTVHAEGYVDHVIEIDAKDHTAIPARVALDRAPAETGSVRQGSAAGSAEPGSAGQVGRAAGSATETGSAALPPAVTAPRATPSLVAPVVASAASGVAGGVALGFYLAARRSAQDAGKTADMAQYNGLVDTATNRQHVSWALGGLAGVGAMVSVVLWYRYASAPHVEVQASGSGAAVTLGGRW